MTSKNGTNRVRNKFSRTAPQVLFYVFVIAFLLLGIGSIVALIILLFCPKYNLETVNIIVGLASALLSAGILTNGLATFIRNTLHDKKAERISMKHNVTLLVDDLNQNVISDVTFVIKVMKETIASLKNCVFEFKSVLDEQADQISKFEASIGGKNAFIDSVILCSARQLVLNGSVSSNKDMYDYCLDLFKKDATFNRRAYGAQEVLSIFRQKRIKIFNFFEKVSIQYFNNIVDRDLLISQFGTIINDLVKLCYYDICINEGNSSYPGLQLLCSQLQQDNKGEQK